MRGIILKIEQLAIVFLSAIMPPVMAALEFKLTEEFIELHKLLKLMGLCEHGGEAKHVISEGLVKVNGAVETRKAFKTRAGHKVEFNHEIIEVK